MGARRNRRDKHGVSPETRKHPSKAEVYAALRKLEANHSQFTTPEGRVERNLLWSKAENELETRLFDTLFYEGRADRHVPGPQFNDVFLYRFKSWVETQVAEPPRAPAGLAHEAAFDQIHLQSSQPYDSWDY